MKKQLYYRLLGLLRVAEGVSLGKEDLFIVSEDKFTNITLCFSFYYDPYPFTNSVYYSIQCVFLSSKILTITKKEFNISDLCSSKSVNKADFHYYKVIQSDLARYTLYNRLRLVLYSLAKKNKKLPIPFRRISLKNDSEDYVKVTVINKHSNYIVYHNQTGNYHEVDMLDFLLSYKSEWL